MGFGTILSQFGEVEDLKFEDEKTGESNERYCLGLRGCAFLAIRGKTLGHD